MLVQSDRPPSTVSDRRVSKPHQLCSIMRSDFYTLCPRYPQCKCSDFCKDGDCFSSRTIARVLRTGLIALLPAFAVSATVAAIAVTLTPACAHAGQCGECWNTGTPGTLSADGQSCNPCKQIAPDYTPPDSIGAPRRTEPGAGRNS